MTTIQTLSNFFADVWLEQPDTVLVDDAALTVWRLAAARRPHEQYDDLAVPAYETLDPIPDFTRRGVCTYTPETGELFYFAGFEHERLTGTAADELAALLSERIDAVRELSITVDAHNGFTARVPPRGVCEELPFELFSERVAYDTAAGHVEGPPFRADGE